jgi:hypothetical protein
MITLFQLFGIVGAAIVLYGMCGACFATVLRRHIHFPLLATPLFGLLAHSLGTLTLYIAGPTPLAAASLLTLVALASASAIAAWRERSNLSLHHIGFPLALIVLTTIASIVTVTHAELAVGAIAMLFTEGSDQMGYATLADWFINNLSPTFSLDPTTGHLEMPHPTADPDKPYESYPNFMVSYDPRAASFVMLAQIALLTGRSGMFAFDLACAIVLTAGVCAVSGIFGRSRLIVVLLAVALFSSQWYDYSRTGFFGRLSAFPASMVLFALYASISSRIDRLSAIELSALGILTVATALLVSGAATAHLLAVPAFIFLIAGYVMGDGTARRDRMSIALDRGAVLVMMCVIAVAATGALARPLRATFFPVEIPWQFIVMRLAEVESVSSAQIGLSQGALYILLVIQIIAAVLIVVLAIRGRDSTALALAIGPLLTIGVLRIVDNRLIALQSVGVVYPMLICAAARLAKGVEVRHVLQPNWQGCFQSLTPVLIIFVCIAIHMPRFMGAISRFAGPHTPAEARFTKSDFDRLSAAIGTRSVYIDTGLAPESIAILVELGRRGVDLRWSPDSWRRVLGYRLMEPHPWPVPPSNPQTDLVLILKTKTPIGPERRVVVETPQFRLLQAHQTATPESHSADNPNR